MTSVINTALSGLQASQRRIEVAANNIANQNSTKTNVNGESTNSPFTPQRVDLVSLSNAGVAAITSDVENPTTQIADPTSASGLSEVPNVDVAQQLIEVKLASYDYKANIKAIQIQNNLEDSVLDILS